MYCMYMLRVPIGASRGPAPGSQIPTDLAFASIADRTCNADRTALEHFGKVLVYAVRPGAPEVEEFPAMGPVQALRSFAALLEHFYHSPNFGRWVTLLWLLCAGINKHMRHLVCNVDDAREETITGTHATFWLVHL